MGKLIFSTVLFLIIAISLNIHIGEAKTRYVVRRNKPAVERVIRTKNPGQVYILRRKVPQNKPQVVEEDETPLPTISIASENFNFPSMESRISTRPRRPRPPQRLQRPVSYSMPILNEDQGQRRYDNDGSDVVEEVEEQSNNEGPTDWVSLEQAQAINKAFEIHRQRKQPFTITNIQLDDPSLSRWDGNTQNNQESSYDLREKTPIMVDGRDTSTINGFRSNIPLPRNPYMPQQEQFVEEPQMEDRADHYQPKYQQYGDPERKVSMSVYKAGGSSAKEEGLEEVLQKYLDTLHKIKNINANSRSDVYDTPTSSPSISNRRKYSSASTSHYTKPGSASSESVSRYSSPLQSNQRRDHYAPAESRQSFVQRPSRPSRPQSSPQRDSFISILSKLQHIAQIKDAFPPHGSYTPYGERTIIMMKYPGMPREGAPPSPFSVGLNMLGLGLGGVKPISIPKNNWSTKSTSTKDSDFGVIISQNYILQPEKSINSHYNYDPSSDDSREASSSEGSPSDLVAQLAKALAERNRIVNSYYAKTKTRGSPQDQQKPPFVLVHLETFTKKSNKSTPFGFDDDLETNFANGTIIYPTLTDPTILASTKFEFNNGDDVEHVFDRPLEGYKNGAGMKPIVPLGLVDIQNYLRLMYEVHKDIHDGGRAKVDELKGLSYVVDVDRQKMPGSRTMEEWEKDRINGRFKDNWLHTSTIGIRSLSDYPQLPPRLPLPYPNFV